MPAVPCMVSSCMACMHVYVDHSAYVKREGRKEKGRQRRRGWKKKEEGPELLRTPPRTDRTGGQKGQTDILLSI